MNTQQCGICETEETKFSCCGGCNKGGCMSMGKSNCRAAALCFYCPLRHVYYGCQHCTLCCTSQVKMTPSKLEKHRELEIKDRCFGNSHKYGALCCPCTVTTCFLEVSGCALTYVASFFCFVGGCACKTTTCITSCASSTSKCCTSAGSRCASTGSCCTSAGSSCSSTASTGTTCCCCICCCASSNAVPDQPRSINGEEDAKSRASAKEEIYQPETSGVGTEERPPSPPSYDDPPSKGGKDEIA